ncbi:MAG: redoxin domain-containing protein, partial [Planctomycetota bacterium]
MRLGVGMVLLSASLLLAEGPEEGPKPSIETEVDQILTELRAKTAASRPKELNEKNWTAWQEKYAALRVAAATAVEALVRRHGPGGEGERKDVAPGFDALFSRALMPRADAARALARRLLQLDPECTACWKVLRRLRQQMGEDHPENTPWGELRAWARALREDAGVTGEAGLALDLLQATLAYELDDKRAARKGADLVLAEGKGSDALRTAARRLRSRVSLLDQAQEAPGFRIASLDGSREYALEDYRGRVLLLHFWDLNSGDHSLLSIVEDCHTLQTKIDVAILSIPVTDDRETLEELKKEGALEWPVAAPNDVARQIATAYGVDGISALYLVGPDGRVITAEDWDIGEAAQRVARLVRESVGPPLGQELVAVARNRDWPRFRQLWHGLVARGRTKFDRETWVRAERAGARAVLALLLASAEPPPVPIKVDTSGPHGRLVAVYKKNDQTAWDTATAPLKKVRDDACLAIVDAIFDLGLYGENVRASLERVAQSSARWEAISMALRALFFQDSRTSPKMLRKHLRHKRWQVRLALAEALRAYRHKHGVDILVALLGDKRMRVRVKAGQHLEELTGQALGQSQKKWAKWRRRQGEHIAFLPREISVKNPYLKRDRQYAHRAYYGVQVASNNIIYVLDKSDSMYYGLFDGVVEEMRAHLESAGPTTKFNVIEFDEMPRLWSEKLVPANAAQIREAVTFLKRKRPYGPTNVIDSLRLGMRTPGLDTVVFLSDGLPNRGKPADPSGILKAVGNQNRYARIAIHTVQLLRGRSFKHDHPRDKVPPL